MYIINMYISRPLLKQPYNYYDCVYTHPYLHALVSNIIVHKNSLKVIK